jgi:hypothetical protein
MDRVDHRPDGVLGLLLVTADVEVDEDGRAVLGDLSLVALGVRRLDVRDAGLARDRGDRVVDRLADGRVAGVPPLAAWMKTDSPASLGK